MPAALAAIPPNPSTAAIIAITRKVIVQRSIVVILKMKEYSISYGLLKKRT